MLARKREEMRVEFQRAMRLELRFRRVQFEQEIVGNTRAAM